MLSHSHAAVETKVGCIRNFENAARASKCKTKIIEISKYDLELIGTKLTGSKLIVIRETSKFTGDYIRGRIKFRFFFDRQRLTTDSANSCVCVFLLSIHNLIPWLDSLLLPPSCRYIFNKSWYCHFSMHSRNTITSHQYKCSFYSWWILIKH